MILALYNNSHSYELIKDYCKKFNRSDEKVIYINTGLIPIRTSKFCFFGLTYIQQLINLIKFKKFYLVNQINISKIILPNTIHIICGFLNHYSNMNHLFFLVEEGTKNFHERKVGFNQSLCRLTKFIILFLLNIKYKLHFHDEFEINSRYSIITRFPNLLVTGAKKKITILDSKNYQLENNSILIIGSHILDQKKIIFKHNLFDYFIKDNKYKNFTFLYLPHPRAKKNGLIELNIFRKFINCNLITKYSNAHDAIINLKPKYILALGGSTTFFYFRRKLYKNLYVIGIDELISNGHLQYHYLKKIYKNLGVNVL